MTEKHYETAPEDRIPFYQKFVYGLGALCNQLLTAAMSVLMIVLNLGLKMNPALVGYIMAIPRFTDAITDPIMGYITDRTKSRWGRRRPYIFFGAIFSATVFILMWRIPDGLTEYGYFIYFSIFSILYYISYTIFATPFVALGYEMTPDYHERTRIMSIANTVGQFAWTITPWLYPILWGSNLIRKPVDKIIKFFGLPESLKSIIIFDNLIDGARGISIWVGIFVLLIGTMPAIFIKERFYKIAEKEVEEEKTREKSTSQELLAQFKSFFINFFITLKNPNFIKLCAAMFLIFNGFNLIAGLGPYNIIYYLYKGNQDKASSYMCWFFSVSSLMTSIVIPIISWISTQVGKKKAFYISTSISIFGYILKWFLYNPEHPYLLFLATPFIGFGLGGLFTLVGAMMADVCDEDELNYGKRREGMFGAVNWWVVKLGMAIAFALSGHILNFTGFDVNIGAIQPERTLYLMRLFEIGIPIITSILAIISIFFYPITEEKAHEIRTALERKRGKVE